MGTKRKPGATGATGAKTGRPSAYKPDYAREARNLCFLGATEPELARAFGVSVNTIDNWKKAHPEFLGALKEGREVADSNVAKRLYARALGYSHKAVKILTVSQGNNEGSVVEAVPYVERYPPDTTACIFWLKNRRPDQWRDKQSVDLGVTDDLAKFLRDL